MSFHTCKVYSRLIGIGLVFLVLVLFLASNRQVVTVSFVGWEIWQAPLFAIMFSMAGLGVLIYLTTRRIRKIIHDVQQVRRQAKEKKVLTETIQKEIQRKSNGINQPNNKV